MTTRISIDSNVGSVIQSVDDVKDDLRDEFEKRVGAAMRVLWSDTRQYVLDDPHTSGGLFRSIKNDSTMGDVTLSFKVYADTELAAYAAITEFGSGQRTNIPFERGNNVPGSWPSIGSSVPVGFPYEAPDMDFNEDNPINTGGYPKFYGFVKHIEDWMHEKGVMPMTGDYFASAALIAATIIRRGNYAHPFLRPAWFDNELQIKRAARNAVKNATR